jgi:kynurenine 3-monooxygenase
MPIGEGQTVTIVGAGLAGSLLACYLAKLGFRVNVYERRGDPRKAGYAGGRSINLALSARGLWGLQGVGLDQEILRHALPMKGRMIHPEDPEAAVYFQPYSKDPRDAINSISRGGLNMALLDAAERQDNVELFFNQRCLEVDPERGTVTFQDESAGAGGGGGPVGTVEAGLIVGADGAFSAVRARMQRADRFEYSQTYLGHGYKELHIPALPEGDARAARFGGFALDPAALHIWPRGSAMMIALPNPDRSFTCTLFWPFEGEHSFAALRTPSDVRAFFRTHYPDAAALMPTLEEDFERNPTGSLVTVRCWPWWAPGKGGRATVLVGDAAHAIVPFFGQGMNAGFEDVRVLSECLERHAGKGEGCVQAACEEYGRLRKPNADAIARMALDNFVEMRDKVGSRVFMARKHAEHFLHDLFPEALTPKYNLVSFSTVPYAEALRRGARMDRVLRVLVLLGLLVGANVLLVLRFPAWALVVAVLVGGWVLWDRWKAGRDTAV